MTVQNKAFEVKVQLQPAVRQINRAPKKIAAAAESPAKRGRLPRITQVLAIALQFQEMIDRGEIPRHADLARLGCISRERISQMMVLTWLAPDIQEAILRLPVVARACSQISEGLLRSIARFARWEIQRSMWREATTRTVGGCQSIETD